MDNIVITVARGFGSGGKEIASKVAKDLGNILLRKQNSYACISAQRS